MSAQSPVASPGFIKAGADRIRRDVRLGWRGLVRQKGFFLLVVTVLSTGMGSAVAAFAVFEAGQLRSLPFTDPGRLVQVAMAHHGRPLEAESVYRQDLLAFADRRELLEDVGAFFTGTANLSDGGRTERYEAAFVTPNLFALLGLRPAAGRNLSAADAVAGAPAVTVISDELWRTRYASAPEIVGHTIRVNRRPTTVVGVMPPGFAFPHRQRLWLPMGDVTLGDAADMSRVIGVGRLAPSIRPETLSEALTPVFDDARRRRPERYQGYALRVQPLSWFFVDWQARASQRLLLIAVIALLLVATANAAGLMVAHARQRESEWALRTALGAPRGDRLRATLASGAIVSAASLGAALVFARAALTWLEGELQRSEDPMPYFLRLEVTGTTLLFACGAAILAAAALGVLPGVRGGSVALTSGTGARATGSRGAARLSGGLVALQVALSLTILTGMSVMLAAVESMGRRDVGAVTAGVLTVRMALIDENSAGAERARFWTQLVDRLRDEPGILAATVGSAVPGFSGGVEAVRPEGAEAGREVHRTAVAAVDASFLETYGVALLAGRGLTSQDRDDSPAVALVDQRFAASAWPGRNPIGRRLDVGTARGILVVGVTGNLHLAQVDDPPRGTILVPLLQHPPRFASLAVRTTGDPYGAVPAVRTAVEGLDPDVPLYWVQSLEDAIRSGFYNVRIFARVIGWLGLSALLVAAAGLYTLMSGRVLQRTREIGIRRALGASPVAIVKTVVGQVVVPLAAGAALGLSCSWRVATAVVALEPSVLGAGSGTYGMALGTLAVASALALAGPTARALIVSPLEALRHE